MEPKKPLLAWIEATEARPGLNGLWKYLDHYLHEQAGDEFDITFASFPRPAGGVRQLGPRLLSEVMGLAAADAAAKRGADLVIFNDWAMPVYSARAHLEIPVTGVAEASAVLGSVLAQRPAIVTVAEGLRWGFEKDIREFGLSSKFLYPPVWWLDPQSTHEDVQEAVDDPLAYVQRFDDVASQAVAAGADAILVGCGYVGPVLAHAGYTHVSGHPDVPVLDCTRLSFELGVLLYRLAKSGISPSRVGFAQPAPEAAVAVEKALNHIQTSDGDVDLLRGRLWRSE
jgi:Asp/Glu/hydantoin racemase